MINDLLSLSPGITDHRFTASMCVIGSPFFSNGLCGKGRKENCLATMISMGGQ